ncbi:hypothetical protein H5410_064787 [Solanum commersonii]|uniref:NB-ARC domain-containing protein n=1 Tax=Solanum commersonii TaxID=4109 RepID=A0A9J5VYD6_SOLCO|nr:hypothetical protein H5410_064787 [Solanum commersonii]
MTQNEIEEMLDHLRRIKNLNDVWMVLLEKVRYVPLEENLEMHKFTKQLKIVQKKMGFLRYLYDTEINGYVNHEKLECLETRIQFMANNEGQLYLAVSVILVSDFVDNTNEDESFLDSLIRKLNEMSKSKSSLDFLMKPLLGNLEKELSALTSILEKDLSSLSSIFRDVAKMHHEHEILQDLHRCTINLAYEVQVAIESIPAQYNVFWHTFCSLPTILKEINKINRQVTEMWLADVALKPCYVVAPFKHLPTRQSNPVTDEEIGTREVTIARKVYNCDNTFSHFDVRAWCIVCQTYNRRKLLQEILSQVTSSKDKGDKDDILADELRKSLMCKRYLIEDCPPDLLDVSQAVAEKCKGLPLVVVLVAGIIKKRKMEDSWWNEVKDSLFDYLDHESEEYSWAMMQLSFDNSADCLKPCLLYMGMFSEDARIPMSKLISLWIAEHFVENIESVEGYLMDLISSNVVMVSKKEYNGKVKYCQVHDVVLHFCLEKSREDRFILAVKGHCNQLQPFEWKESRVSYNFSKELSKFASLRSKTRKPFHQHLRSLITINDGEFIDGIPFSTLKPLNHLKYLAVSTVIFYFHPESHLPHLETLIVNSEWPFMLPASFWETKKLRHFDIWRAEFDFEEDKQGLFEGSSKLENLSILKNIVRFPIDRVHVLLRRCPNLQQLHIEFEYRGDNDSAGDCCLGDVTFHKLKLLKLVFLSISRWNAAEESFPLLETLVISGCKNLVEIPLSFADIPTLKQIKLIRWYNKSLEASAVRIKEEVEAIEGCDRIVITTQYLYVSNMQTICSIQEYKSAMNQQKHRQSISNAYASSYIVTLLLIAKFVLIDQFYLSDGLLL